MTTNRLISLLREKKLTIAIAESCTAGYVSYLLTKTSGSSDVFKGGCIVYSLSSKVKLLKVNKSLVDRTHGVSARVCSLLAQNIRTLFSADIGLAIVGFAGPSSPKNIKAGTTFYSIATKSKTVVRKKILSGSRDYVRKTISKELITELYHKLQTNYIP